MGILQLFNKSSKYQTYLHKHNYISIKETKPQDVFLCGYPKSGNTWMQHLLTGLFYKMNMEKGSDRLVNTLTPDIHHVNFYKRYNSSVCFKTHSLPKREYRNVINIVRDGRDVITSYYNMKKALGSKEQLEDFISKNDSWQTHVLAWKKNPFNAKICQIKYEKLINSPLLEMRRLIKFLGMDVTDSFLNQLIANCSFTQMKKKENSNLWDKPSNFNSSKSFIRKGVIGSHLKEMPLKLIKEFEINNLEGLSYLGYISGKQYV